MGEKGKRGAQQTKGTCTVGNKANCKTAQRTPEGKKEKGEDKKSRKKAEEKAK